MPQLLIDLEPAFRVIKEPGRLYQMTDAIYDPVHGHAHGISFLCPKCFAANANQRPGVHGVCVWFRDRGVSDAEQPGPARWAMSGTCFADLTLAPSILLLGGCGWHGWVQAGVIASC
jgi:hypothetical protein